MNGGDISGITAVAVLTAVGGAEIALAVKGKAPTIKPVIGGFLLGATLLIIGSINSQLGEAFAILVIIGSLLTNGVAIFNAASTASTAKAPAK